MLISITIPTIKKEEELKSLNQNIIDYTKHTKYQTEIIFNSCMQSAAKNRNACIDKSNGDICVQIDDDIVLYKNDWLDNLIDPLIQYQDKISIIAARLYTIRKEPAPQLGTHGMSSFENIPHLNIACHTPETKYNVTCTACIAFFKSNDIRFDENYQHAAYEDTDFMFSTNLAFPKKKIIINMNSNVIHMNHGSWRKGGTHELNKQYFRKKWNINNL